MYLPRRFLPIFGAATIAATAYCHAVELDRSMVARTPGSLLNSYDIAGLSRSGSRMPVAISGNTNKLTTNAATVIVAPIIATSLPGATGRDHSLIVAGDLKRQNNLAVNPTILSAFSCLAALGLMFYPHVKQRAGR